MNVTVFVVRVWGGEYREELILNVTVFVVRVWGGQYREELILNITLMVGGSGEGNIERNRGNPVTLSQFTALLEMYFFSFWPELYSTRL